jgi:hypothetical protein
MQKSGNDRQHLQALSCSCHTTSSVNAHTRLSIAPGHPTARGTPQQSEKHSMELPGKGTTPAPKCAAPARQSIPV